MNIDKELMENYLVYKSEIDFFSGKNFKCQLEALPVHIVVLLF